MEYIGGGSLTDLLKTNFTEAQMAALLKEALIALEFLHNKQRMIHRDVKSDNLLFTKSGQVKFVDFGFTASKALNS